MKHKNDRYLAAAAVLSLPLCLWAWFFDIRLLLVLPAVPALCIQLLLCRRTGQFLLRLIPLVLVALFAGTGALILFLSSGWDGLLGLIMLFASIAPAAGILLAWGGYALYSRRLRKEGGHG